MLYKTFRLGYRIGPAPLEAAQSGSYLVEVMAQAFVICAEGGFDGFQILNDGKHFGALGCQMPSSKDTQFSNHYHS